MDDKAISFFHAAPDALPLYEVIEGKILNAFDDVSIKVDKTQIAFRTHYGFAYVLLPFRKMKNRPDTYVVLSFGLGHKIQDARITEAYQPRAKRWIHHIVIEKPQEVDEQVMDWLHQAYAFSLR